jgi:hypothetical protein
MTRVTPAAGALAAALPYVSRDTVEIWRLP